VSSDEAGGGYFAQGWSDVVASLRNWQIWCSLSVNDTRAKYRRTVLGPWWLVLGVGISLTGMGLVWSTLFGMSMEKLFPYLVAGFVTWQFMQMVVTEGCDVFISGHAASILRNVPTWLFIHVLRMVCRNAILLLHSMGVFVIAALVYRVMPNWYTLALLPGVALLFLNALWVGVTLGVFGARYRDIGPMVSAVMSVLFFLTPIVWMPEQLGERGYLAMWNPFTHAIAVIREPLLGNPVPAVSWAVSLGLGICGSIFAAWIFGYARRRVAFWI